MVQPTLLKSLNSTQKITQKIEDRIKDHQASRVEISRPTWDNVFLNLAKEISKRSHDSQTHCGCVIVNEDNEVVVMGFNGFVRHINDTILSNVRPLKYDWMIHSEVNAILNASRQGKSLDKCRAYITGPPCFNCLMMLIQSGIKEIVHGKQFIHMLDEEQEINKGVLLKLIGDKIKIREVEDV
jgi:dCMP deaminase